MNTSQFFLIKICFNEYFVLNVIVSFRKDFGGYEMYSPVNNSVVLFSVIGYVVIKNFAMKIFLEIW